MDMILILAVAFTTKGNWSQFCCRNFAAIVW